MSHYNSITEPCARFLSLLDGLAIDFPSHFVLSLIDVHRNTTTRDKLIFPSAISWILRHFSVSYLESTHFSPMCAIDTATVRRNEAQLRPKWPQTEMVTPPASSTPSTSTPSSFAGGVTLEAIVAQLVRMDARLPSSPSPLTLEDKSDDGSDSDDADEDDDASSFGDNKMTA